MAKLDKLLNISELGDRTQLLRLVSPTGEEIELPETVVRLLRKAVYHLGRNNGVIIFTFHQPLTIEEAAYLLNVRWQQFEQLLEDGEITFTDTGLERRIQFDDLRAYKKKHLGVAVGGFTRDSAEQRRVRLVRVAVQSS